MMGNEMHHIGVHVDGAWEMSRTIWIYGRIVMCLQIRLQALAVPSKSS